MTSKSIIVVMCLASCNLGPRADDPIDSALPPDMAVLPDGQKGFMHILPAGADVPSTSTDNALLVQIRINDGVLDTAPNFDKIPRVNGKSAGGAVKFWNFGPVPTEGSAFVIAVVAPIYAFGTLDDAGVFTESTTHKRLIDSIPGDIRYSPIRRIVNVPFTPLYNDELITSVDALNEAIERGLVGEPVNDAMVNGATTSNTFINLPVVLPTATLEVGPLATDVITPKQVFGRGFLVDVFEIGSKFGRQPFRNNFVPIGQASGLQTGVPLGNGSLPTAIDTAGGLVFQYAIPGAAPLANAPTYSPLAADVTVRLASGVAPTAVTTDADLYTRAAPGTGVLTGAITGFFPSMVSTFTIGTIVNNLQIQFEETMP